MRRAIFAVVVVSLLSVLASPVARGDSDPAGALGKRLVELAAQDPQVAKLLADQAAERESRTYSEEEFQQYAGVDCAQYHLSPGGTYILSTAMTGSGSINATLGAGVTWTDVETSATQSLSYAVRIKYSPQRGLGFDLTLEPPDAPPIATEYIFTNLDPITVVLREMEDGSRHVVRLVPTLDPKPVVLDYSQHLTISLRSAVLLVDDQFAGEFTVTGDIVGITSSLIGAKIELGLKPFKDAQPIGRTDGMNILFDHDGRQYELRNSQAFTTSLVDGGVWWKVYVRAMPTDSLGTGSYSMSYAAFRLNDVLGSIRGD